MSDFESYIIITISNISIQLDIIKTVLNTYIIIEKNININMRSIYIMLNCIYDNLVSLSISQSSFWDNSDNMLTVDTEQVFFN